MTAPAATSPIRISTSATVPAAMPKAAYRLEAQVSVRASRAASCSFSASSMSQRCARALKAALMDLITASAGFRAGLDVCFIFAPEDRLTLSAPSSRPALATPSALAVLPHLETPPWPASFSAA